MNAHIQSALTRLHRNEAGEGVISTGIAVLIMALIGAAMWVAFSGTFSNASEAIDGEVSQMIQDGGSSGQAE